MLLDKASTMKNMLNDVTRMKKIIKSMKRQRQAEVNIKLETITGVMGYISLLILLDFRSCYQELGLKNSPIEQNEKLFYPIRNEMKAFELNTRIYNEMVDFYKSCMESFFILVRQVKKKIFDETESTNLIKAISEARYSLGKLHEEFIIHERILNENVNKIKI